MGIGSSLLVLLAVRLHRPPNAGGWVLLSVGVGAFAAGDELYYAHEALTGTPAPYPWWSDALYLSSYVFLLLGLLWLARGAGRVDRASVIDATIVATGVGLPLWVFYIGPAVAEAGGLDLPTAVAISYPIGDVLVLAAAAHLWFVPLRHSPAVRMLACAVPPLIFSDVVYTGRVIEGTWVTGTWLDLGWQAFYILPAAAALHPSVARSVTRRPDTVHLTPTRVAGLVAASLVAPVMLLLQDTLGRSIASIPIAVTFVLITVLVLLRVSHLVESLASAQEKQRSATRFETLVQSGSDLIMLVEEAGTVRYTSPSSARVLGPPPEALTGTPLLELVHPADVARMADYLARGFEGRSGGALEVRLQGPEGSWRWVESLASAPRVDEDGTRCLSLTSRDVSERKELEEQLTAQALHDPLTGLANRRLFADRVEQALAERGAEDVVVLFLDLDDFKVVNDSLGHGVGDELLTTIARRLVSQVRAGDTVARLGGDEFAVLLDHDVRLSEAESAAARLIAALHEPVVLASTELRTRVSIGIAPAQPGDTGEDVLRNADLAMYMAKGAGKGRSATFQPEMYAATVGRLELLADLRSAIDEGELRLHYQPTVQLSSGAVTGVEALVRWQHPVRGLISPAQFIPLAEESGLVVPLGRWVLRQACREAVGWPVSPGRPPVSIAVNLSTRHLSDPTVVDDVRLALEESGLEPARLVVEITETGLVDDEDVVLGALHALKAVGVRLAVDDFGTGYSSLSYLKRFPIDVLKVDKSFVDGLGLGGDGEATGLVEAILGMARTLRMSTVAEGIEDAEQLSELASLGCDNGQGYLLSRPVPADQLVELLSRTLMPVAEPAA